MNSRYVVPETRTLTISDGDTLVVRKRLNRGEQTAAFARRYTHGHDGRLRLNPEQVGLALVTAYLLDWSLRYPDGKSMVILDKPIEEKERLLNALDPADFDEIKDAIEKHENEMAAERAAAKKSQAGETVSPATSLLPSDAAGRSTTSAG